MPESITPNHSTQPIHSPCSARSLRGQSPPSPTTRAMSSASVNTSVNGVVLAMCQNMSSGYREPSISTDLISAHDNGALFVAAAIENASTITASDNANTDDHQI